MERLGKILNVLIEYDKYLMRELREPTDKNVSMYEHWIDCKYEIEKQIEEMKNLEEQGKLLKLPCAVGDTVYVIEVDEENFTHFYCPTKISEYKFNLQMLDLLGMFGKCIFLTQEAAEAALKEMSE